MLKKIIACIAALHSIPAHAIIPENGVLVSAQELILVGAGIQANRANDSIALACTDSSCQNLRFVSFHKNKEAYFFGETFPGLKTDSGSDLSQQVEKIAEEVLVIRNADHRNEKSRGIVVVLVAAIGSSVAFAITSSVAPFLIVIGGLAVLQLSEGPEGNSVYQDLDIIGHIRNKKNKVMRIMGRVKSTQVFLNQDGWNWTETPQTISRNKFCTALVAITYPHYVASDFYDNRRYWAIRSCKEYLK